MLASAAVIGRLDWGWGSISKIAYLHAWPQVRCPNCSSCEPFCRAPWVSLGHVACFPPWESSPRGQGGSCNPFSDLASKVMFLVYAIGHTNHPWCIVKGTHNGKKSMSWGSLGTVLEAGYYRFLRKSSFHIGFRWEEQQIQITLESACWMDNQKYRSGRSNACLTVGGRVIMWV